MVSLSEAALFDALDSGERWFINFFTPQCVACPGMLPYFRDASIKTGYDTASRFAKFDCDRYPDACHQLGIDVFPSPMFYNGSRSAGHFFDDNQDDADAYVTFIQDVLNPAVVLLTPGTCPLESALRRTG